MFSLWYRKRNVHKQRSLLFERMPHQLEVHGMSCEGCEETVEEALQTVAGVTTVRVDHESDSVAVEGNANLSDLVAAVEDTGYDVASDA